MCYIEDQKLKPDITEISSTKMKPTTSSIKPKYIMLQEPETGYPQFLVVEVELPRQVCDHAIFIYLTY